MFAALAFAVLVAVGCGSKQSSQAQAPATTEPAAPGSAEATPAAGSADGAAGGKCAAEGGSCTGKVTMTACKRWEEGPEWCSGDGIGCCLNP